MLHAGASMPLDPARAVYALHAAIREARDRFPTALSLWACYLHAGASTRHSLPSIYAQSKQIRILIGTVASCLPLVRRGSVAGWPA
jgi:hypothetical protein